MCGCNRAQCLANVALVDTIDGRWEVWPPIGAIYQHIAANIRNPNFGLHGVRCVIICGISGMHEIVVAATGQSAAVVVRDLFQSILYNQRR